MLKVAYKSDAGLVRDNNEDSFFVDEEKGLLIVADGIGGHVAGEVASTTAIDTISSVLNSGKSENDLVKAIEKANEAIVNKINDDKDLTGMGTTVVAVLINKDLNVAWVGDSRAYLIKDEITQITEDHSVVTELIKAGKITEEQARHHHLRHIVTRALGGKNSTPEVRTFSWEKGDYLLLCTDGLTDMVEDEEIKDVIKGKGSLKDKVDKLVDLAKAGGGKDNITIILAYKEQ